MGSSRIFKGCIYFNTLGIWRISSSSFPFSFKHTVLISIQFNQFWFSHFILSIKLMMSWPTSFPAIFWWFHVTRQNRMPRKSPFGVYWQRLYNFFFFFFNWIVLSSSHQYLVFALLSPKPFLHLFGNSFIQFSISLSSFFFLFFFLSFLIYFLLTDFFFF